jgi:phosphate transport system permease protein
MSNWQTPEASARLKKRYAAERRFKALGAIAIILSLSFLAFLLFVMVRNGISGIDWSFLTASDSTNAADAGIWGAFKGSLLTMAITLGLSFPMGVLAAIYLEEFAPRQRWVEWVEVSINNLAAVPSIIFGLLGLAIFHPVYGDASILFAGWRHDAGTDDDAGHCHFRSQCDKSSAAIHP